MKRADSLRSRLIATYVGGLLIGLLIFAAAAIVTIDRTLRASVDSRLITTAQGISAIIDIRNGRIELDPEARAQFLSLLGLHTSGAIVDNSGAALFSNVSDPPEALRGLVDEQPAFHDVTSGGTSVRAFVLPVRAQGQQTGKVVVWQPVEWIGQTIRGALFAFALGALVIAALALVVGGAITRRALEDAFARQRRFTDDASHELRAPLAIIRAESDLALRKERDAAGYRQALATIADEADRMEALVGDLLSMARAETRAFARHPVDISAAVRSACDRSAASARAKGVSLRFDQSGDARIVGDADALERALLAVLHNAVKYTPAGGDIEVATHTRDGSVEIVVRNSGSVFTADALEHARDRFWREHTSSGEGGTGLGLAIARSMVEACDGQLELANTADHAEVRMTFRSA